MLKYIYLPNSWELITWMSKFKYQYTKKFLYQPRKWLFGQPARKHTGDPQIARFMGPIWGPPGPQMGPMLTPWTLLSGPVNSWKYLSWRKSGAGSRVSLPVFINICIIRNVSVCLLMTTCLYLVPICLFRQVTGVLAIAITLQLHIYTQQYKHARTHFLWNRYIKFLDGLKILLQWMYLCMVCDPGNILFVLMTQHFCFRFKILPPRNSLHPRKFLVQDL